jgi:hypothetical protein
LWPVLPPMPLRDMRFCRIQIQSFNSKADLMLTCVLCVCMTMSLCVPLPSQSSWRGSHRTPDSTDLLGIMIDEKANKQKSKLLLGQFGKASRACRSLRLEYDFSMQFAGRKHREQRMPMLLGIAMSDGDDLPPSRRESFDGNSKQSSHTDSQEEEHLEQRMRT